VLWLSLDSAVVIVRLLWLSLNSGVVIVRQCCGYR
jgi:hypothetical protein